jgi:Type VI secretion system/phage-baseplate injector OB domain
VTTEDGEPRFYGKFRGVVVANVDPHDRARIMVQVPEVIGDSQAWALPCFPYSPSMEKPAVPPVGDGVWVEFEAGEPARPIWSGVGWDI